jgi:hypothetical protein
LRDGYFASPVSFETWKEKLNMSGLLPAPDLAYEYVKAYQAAAEAGTVEELAESPYGLDVIRIAKVEL